MKNLPLKFRIKWALLAAVDWALRPYLIGRAILRVRDHHARHPSHGSNCACLDKHAGDLRRLIFSSLPHDVHLRGSLPDGSPDPESSEFRSPTASSLKRMAAVRTVFGYLNR